MFSKNFKVFFIFTIVLISFLSAVSSTDASNVSPSSIDKSNLRKGFEFIFSTANSFIDAIKINIPNEILPSNVTTITQSELTDNLSKYFNSDYFNKIYQISPGLIIFLIIELIFIILLPIFGFIVCCCRCCCAKKFFNEKEKENDKLLRKIFFGILVFALVFLSMLVVIMFVTNSYAYKGIHRTVSVFNNSAENGKNFINNDLGNFSNSINNSIFSFKPTIMKTLNDTEDKILDEILYEINNLTEPIFSKITKEYLAPLNYTKEINSIVNGSEYLDWQEKVNSLIQSASNTGIDSTTKFLVINIDLSSLNQFSNKSYVFDFDAAIQTAKDKLDNFNRDTFQSVDSTLADTSETLNNAYSDLKTQSFEVLDDIINSNNDIKNYISYYDYAYYSLLGISILVLLILLHYIFGSLGIFCKKRGSNRRCHRGVASVCLLWWIAYIFIFGSLLLIISMFIFTFGFFGRNIVCKPLIYLDDDQFIKIVKKIDTIKEATENLSFKNIIQECRDKNSMQNVNELKNLLINVYNVSIDDYVQTKKYMTIIDEKIDDKLLDFNSTNISFGNITINYLVALNTTGIDFIKNDFNTKIPLHKTQIAQVQQFLGSPDSNSNTISEQVNFLRNTIQLYNESIYKLENLVNEWYLNLKNNSQNVMDINIDLKNINGDLNNQTFLNNLLKNKVTGIINNFTKIEIENSINSTLSQESNMLPSCKLLSSIYDDLTVNFCYEVLDNINGFWFSLWILISVFAVLLGFVLKYFCLLRKKSRYNDATEF